MFLFERLESILSYDLYKMKMKTKLLEDYVTFVDSTKKQNAYFKIFIVFCVIT